MNLIDINLLAEKEKKSPVFFYSIAIICLLFFVGCLFFFFSLRSIQEDTERTTGRISQTKQLIEVHQTKLLDSGAAGGTSQLEKTIQTMKDYPIDTVPVLNKLISLLPSRGFIQTFEYSVRQRIETSVQFDSSREAAYYLHRIKEVDWIEEAEILELTTVTEEEAGIDERDVVPRYVVGFTILLNTEKLQQMETEDASLVEEDEE
ncbi:hypothetical protein QTG56_11920 [Rossellomorea sp. AcN35-11]|nr:hypothetical protein [Rossellomorea aquimaris]WJV27885.1 hypothetical protein QTG56_11920 [Rossellomorea sp. AcN35-11]